MSANVEQPEPVDLLPSWREGDTKGAILDFVARVTRAGSPDFVPPAERIAVFDNDGTLWCEKPLPIQADFLLRRLGEMAARDPDAARAPALEGGRRAGTTPGWAGSSPSTTGATIAI